MDPLLEVQNLSTEFFSRKSSVTAIRDISFSIEPGQVLGLVGESGCGKSVTSLSIMNLLPENARISSGKILFKGLDLTCLPEKEFFRIRGNKISMIFQDSLTSLNPVKKIGAQLSEVFIIHKGMKKREALVQALTMLQKVGIPSPRERMNAYPHELSGGMRQRVMIAMAFACSPELLIADEPTTALDVTIQGQILTGIRHLKNTFGTAILFITHDFGVMAEMADDLLVMYAGEVVEYASADIIFENPLHPYTQDLLKSIPRMDKPQRRLYSIKGTVPQLMHYFEGCRFAGRCSYAQDICTKQEPPLSSNGGHAVRCWLQKEGGHG